MPETVDLREQPRDEQGQFQPFPKVIASFPVGTLVTGVNGTDTVWRVVRQGMLKKVEG